MVGINSELFGIISNLAIISQGLSAGVAPERFHGPVSHIEANVDQFISGVAVGASLMRSLGMAREPLAAFVFGTADALRKAVGDDPEVQAWVHLIAEQALQVVTGDQKVVDHGDVARQSAHRVYESVVSVALAHDIKNAGAAIKSLIEELRAQSLPAESIAAILGEMEDQTDLMVDATDDFRRQMGGQPESVRQILDLSDFLTERKVRSVVGQKIEIVFEKEADSGTVSCAKAQLWRGIGNLLKNAREAMEGRETKKLTLSVANVHFGAGGHMPASHYVCLTIRDTGAGIPKDRIDSIFEPFHSSKNPGAAAPIAPMRGIGLWQVRDLVQRHGGFLSVKSTDGVGTAFHLHLPAVPRASSMANALEGYLAGVHEDKRILVVDDSPILLKLLDRYLKYLGYKNILAASSGEEALALADGQPLDLIITDHNMTGIDGIEMSRRIRERLPRFPIILASATADLPFAEDRNSRKVPKPATILEIARVVKELLSLRETDSEPSLI